MPDLAPLIVFSDDWGRHPSSCQHLITKILPRRSVTWVNTIGTRPPGLNWSTITRGLGKLKSWAVRPNPPAFPKKEGRRPHGSGSPSFLGKGPGVRFFTLAGRSQSQNVAVVSVAV